MTAIASLSLFWNSLRALWFKVDKAEGIVLMPEDAPALFEALERIRRKMAGPGIDAVYLTRGLQCQHSPGAALGCGWVACAMS